MPDPVTMQTVDALLPHTVPHLPRCPENVQLSALKVAAAQWFRDTETWALTLEWDDQTTDADGELLLALADGTALDVVVRRLWTLAIDGEDFGIDTAAITLADANDTDMGTTLKITGLTPADTVDVEAVVIVEESRDDSGYPIDLMHRFGLAIAHRAIADLKMMSAPWRDLQGAEFFDSQYRRDVGAAKRDKWGGNKDINSAVVTGPRFA